VDKNPDIDYTAIEELCLEKRRFFRRSKTEAAVSCFRLLNSLPCPAPEWDCGKRCVQRIGDLRQTLSAKSYKEIVQYDWLP